MRRLGFIFFGLSILILSNGIKASDKGKLNSDGESNLINVYFGSRSKNSKGIYHSTFDVEKGRLSQAKLAAEISFPGFLALHPFKNILYAVSTFGDESVVVGYKIESSGLLTKFTTSQTQNGEAAHIAVHHSGKFLLTAQYGSGSTAVFQLNIDGKIGNAVITEHYGATNAVPSRQSNPHPHWCGFSPDGQYAFVPDLGMDGIVIYKVDEEKGSIEKHGFAKVSPGSGPRHMRFSVNGKFIYLLNELSLSVATFKYDINKGTAELTNNTPSLSEEIKAQEAHNSAGEILVHQNGRFIFSSNRGHDSITSYKIDPNSGIPSVIGVEPIRGSWPRNINMDPTGQWLLSGGEHSNTISVHQINQNTGELSFLHNSIINIPEPVCILFVK